MLKHIFNYPKVTQKSTTLILSRRATQHIIIFIFCYTELFFSSLDYSKILLKKSLQLIYHGLLFLLSVAATEAGHRREYLVNVCACCAYCSITKSILHELGGLVCFQVLTCDNLIQFVLLTLLFICLPLEQKIGI